MDNRKTGTIKSFKDLRVYQQLYKAQITVLTRVASVLPKEERYDLADQMRRACKAPPALLAEGFAKRYQPKNWKKYLDDSIGECNEMTNHLAVCRDVYSKYIDPKLSEELIGIYDGASRQLFRLRETWQDFHNDA